MGLAHEALDRDGRSAVEDRHGGEVDHVGFRVFRDAIERGRDRCGGPEEEGAGDPVVDDVRVGRGRHVVGLRPPPSALSA